MPRFKKALEINNIDNNLRKKLDSSPSYVKQAIGKGSAGKRVTEAFPDFYPAAAERIFENGTNAYLVIGKDRPGSILSGYGGRGDSGAGTVDVVVGRMSHKPRYKDDYGNKIMVDPSFKLDASRIYVSQKTDIDDNFDLSEGKVGNSVAKAGLAIKSDAVRIISRDGVKIVTGTDLKDSNGEDIYSVSGIDLIAGNDGESLQPLVLGDNVNESLNILCDHIDKLSGIVSSAITYQMKFNAKVSGHTHISPFYGVPTAPSEILIPAGAEVAANLGTKTIPSLVKFRTNLKFHKQTYYAVSGAKYINSSFNTTN